MRILTNLLTFFISIHFIIAQCPSVSYIQVDACNGTGSEYNNEFFMINSGSGFNVNDLGYVTPTGGTQGTVSSSDNSDFMATNPCPACFTGCNFVFSTNGSVIPPNEDVLIFTSSELNFSYDFSGLCSSGTLYILVANRVPTLGQFANWNNVGSPNGCSGCTDIGTSDDRTLSLTLTGGCSNSVTYNRCQLVNQSGNCSNTNGDGAAVVFTGGSAAYNNNGCAAPVLPIKEKFFLCYKEKNITMIYFSTASETNNDYFTIERSSDGVEFDAIGEIKGAGNSSSELKYEFTDENPLPSINYYRIKQTDFDGKYSYTDIKSVRHHLGKINISPLRTDGRLQITSTQDNYDVVLYNAAGQEVFRKNTLNGDQTIDIESLEAGIYFVKIVDQTFKVIKY
ncbi:MAG: T9SS type A sorting domain-containing protein [Saprospiraceae bacterium]